MVADLEKSLGQSLGTDFYLMDELLTEEERNVRDKVRVFCDKEVIPIINDYWERAEFPFELVPKIAALNIAGNDIKGYGCPGLSAVGSGLIMLELARGDASVCTFFGVHSGLAMHSISMLGSEEQKQRWLPAMARMEKIGAFGLTEPNHGSDAVALETRAQRDGNEYIINGAKRWIGNASFADVTVIWARDDEGNVGGFLVEKGTPGFEPKVMTGKVSKRAVWQTDITLTERSGVAWEAVGHAIAAYEIALTYAKERIQFDKPLISFQIIQNKLAIMLANVTTMQLLCLRLGQLQEEHKMTASMASMAKMNNARLAREVVADAREMLGGNGILLDYHIARHHADIEAVFTYEGTDTIQSLIVGREITGRQAFSPR
ncbi:MAG: acyl-CoA dehydrogenase [Chloroflexi bacterium]|nr:MAG: acyl-CoA dehydrogenase [Chloroflexota bacterium]